VQGHQIRNLAVGRFPLSTNLFLKWKMPVALLFTLGLLVSLLSKDNQLTVHDGTRTLLHILRPLWLPKIMHVSVIICRDELIIYSWPATLDGKWSNLIRWDIINWPTNSSLHLEKAERTYCSLLVLLAIFIWAKFG
jgi:hypothetical protein